MTTDPKKRYRIEGTFKGVRTLLQGGWPKEVVDLAEVHIGKKIKTSGITLNHTKGIQKLELKKGDRIEFYAQVEEDEEYIMIDIGEEIEKKVYTVLRPTKIKRIDND